jgi:hypothetical protein
VGLSVRIVSSAPWLSFSDRTHSCEGTKIRLPVSASTEAVWFLPARSLTKASKAPFHRNLGRFLVSLPASPLLSPCLLPFIYPSASLQRRPCEDNIFLFVNRGYVILLIPHETHQRPGRCYGFLRETRAFLTGKVEGHHPRHWPSADCRHGWHPQVLLGAGRSALQGTAG